MDEKVLVTALNKKKALEVVMSNGERVYVELVKSSESNAHLLIKAVETIKINRLESERKQYYENKR